MSPSNSNHGEGRIELPQRPVLVEQPQQQRQRADGTLEREGPDRISENEVIAPTRKWERRKFKSKEDRTRAIEEAVSSLRALSPPFPAVVEALRTEIESMGLRPRLKLWLIVHARDSSLPDLGRGLAGVLFDDEAAFVIEDCAVPENSEHRLFGTPPGFSGCLEGGVITNQLKIRPESVVILANFEVADAGTLVNLHCFGRDGRCGLLVARGGEAGELEPRDALFVLATSRSFSNIVAASKQSASDAARDALIASIKERPDDLELLRDLYGILMGRILVWH